MLRSYSAFRSSSGALQFGVPTSHDSTSSLVASAAADQGAWAAREEARLRWAATASAGLAAAMVSVSRLCPKSPICAVKDDEREDCG